jgi:hypothetical protein
LNLIFFNIGGHSENFKNSTTLSDDLFLCQVSKGSAVWSELKKNCTLVTMATAAILNFFQPLKNCHTTVDIPTKLHEVS